MIKINCCCRECNIPYTYDFDDKMFCQACFTNHIYKHDKEIPLKIQKLEKEIDILNKKRSSKWYEIKRFSYYTLISMPFLLYLGIKYGLQAELVSAILFLVGSYIFPISVWLADKF